MTPPLSEFENRLNYLTESLLEKLSESKKESFSPQTIEESVSFVMLKFQNRLSFIEKAREDFISTPLNRWDTKVFAPMTKLTEALCLKSLIQKEKDEKRAQHLIEKEKKRDRLREYLHALSIEQDEESDDESLHLEESST